MPVCLCGKDVAAYYMEEIGFLSEDQFTVGVMSVACGFTGYEEDVGFEYFGCEEKSAVPSVC